jgi:hypothetical protein
VAIVLIKFKTFVFQTNFGLFLFVQKSEEKKLKIFVNLSTKIRQTKPRWCDGFFVLIDSLSALVL